MDDTTNEIEMCLHCPLPECNNCLETGVKFSKLQRKHEEWKIRIRELAALGLTDKQMATHLAIHPNTVAILRKEMGIPSLSPRDRKRHERDI
jgi:hypothetical protein